MNDTEIIIRTISEGDIEFLRPLIGALVETHSTLTFKEDYWSATCDWLKKRLKDESYLALGATIDHNMVGFVIGNIQENAPLMLPSRLGHVSILVVDTQYRSSGIGGSLWDSLRKWFVSRGIETFQVYTEFGNKLSGSFWANRGFATVLERRIASHK